MRVPAWAEDKIVFPLLMLLIGLFAVGWAVNAIRKAAEPSIVGKICGEKDGHQYRWVEYRVNAADTDVSCERGN
jgi:hypothetical protein